MTVNTNGDSAGYPVGNRTEEPHHPDGWFPNTRETERNNDMPKRGQAPASGEHDRPTK